MALFTFSSLRSRGRVVGLEFLCFLSQLSHRERTSSSDQQIARRSRVNPPCPKNVHLSEESIHPSPTAASSAQHPTTHPQKTDDIKDVIAADVFARVVSVKVPRFARGEFLQDCRRLALLFYPPLFPIECRNPHHSLPRNVSIL